MNDRFEFVDSEEPDFIIFGPYGNDIPQKSDKYTRIGYFCENIKPDLSICEWAFGMVSETIVNDARYRRIQWHDLDPQDLVKPVDFDAAEIAAGKKKFCNFFYSHRVPYREEFFRQLSRYKKVDAPGKSMNNMPGIDEKYQGSLWERKRKFLSEYKFTIAFENYSYPGYQTEKLFDAMQVNSIPIYCGDPNVELTFNTKSFVNTADHIKANTPIANWLEKHSQPDFVDIRPQFYKTPIHRIRRKLKSMGRDRKMHFQLNRFDFGPLIERIIELDENDDKYIQMLNEPWFKQNHPPVSTSLREHWSAIFTRSIA